MRATVSPQPVRRAPGPIPSCIRTIEPGRSLGPTRSSISEAESPPPITGTLRPQGKLEAKRAGDLHGKGCEYAPRRTPESGADPLAPELSQTVPDVGFDLLARLFRVPHVLRAVELNPVPIPENVGDHTWEPPGQWGHDEERGSGLGSL